MRYWIDLCEASVNRHAELESLPDDLQQLILQKVVDYVRWLASTNRTWHRRSAEVNAENRSPDADQRIVDAWWESGAPVPEIDGLTVASDGTAFAAWARDYLGLPEIDQ